MSELNSFPGYLTIRRFLKWARYILGLVLLALKVIEKLLDLLS